MNTGSLRWRVQLQVNTPTPASNGLNHPSPSWSTVGTYWAQIKTPTGREQANATQQKAELTHIVTMRYRPGEVAGLPDVGPLMRLLYKQRVFNVLWVNNVDERNRSIDVYCQEKVGQAP